MLQTDRLTIRNFNLADANDLYDYLSLPDTYIFEPGSPISKEEAKKLCVERSKSNYFLAVELRVTHKMIGHLYFSRSEPLDFMTWELGYIFNPKYFYKGFCTEASRAIIKYAFNELQAHRIEAFCNPLNAASWHVLEKAGMKREGYFKEKAFFRKDMNGNPLWHDCYAYGLGDKDFMNK